MRLRLITILSLVAFVFWTGCATLLTGTYDEVSIRSEPEGAWIYINGLEEGRTPDTIFVKRAGLSNTIVTLRLEGFEPYSFQLREEFNAVSVINLFSPLAWAIDIATGAVTRYSPRGYDVDLIPEEQAFYQQDLQQEGAGRYIVTEQGDRVVLTDLARGVRLVFER